MLSREKPATERAWKFVMSCGYQPGVLDGEGEKERERRERKEEGEERGLSGTGSSRTQQLFSVSLSSSRPKLLLTDEPAPRRGPAQNGRDAAPRACCWELELLGGGRG